MKDVDSFLTLVAVNDQQSYQSYTMPYTHAVYYERCVYRDGVKVIAWVGGTYRPQCTDNFYGRNFELGNRPRNVWTCTHLSKTLIHT